jgi:hypothetical protein
MLEPRDESLMRKKKVIEILKTFQETDENNGSNQVDQKGKNNKSQKVSTQNNALGNFGEQFDQVVPKIVEDLPVKKKSNSNIPLL